MNLTTRRQRPERMDNPSLDPQLHDDALRGLRRINAWSRTAPFLWRAIVRLASSRKSRSLRILDVACGGGDLLISLGRLAKQAGYDCQLEGWDISPQAIAHAQMAAQQAGDGATRWQARDALAGEASERFDFVIATLFLHHLDTVQSEALLRRLASLADHAVLVDDLIRSSRGYGLAWLGCRLLTRSPVVHYDGPVSVAGAYTIAEVAELARKAGLHGASFQPHWPCRFLMTWRRPSA